MWQFQVKKLLADDPGNSEYADMEKELEEVILLSLFYFFPCYLNSKVIFTQSSRILYLYELIPLILMLYLSSQIGK